MKLKSIFFMFLATFVLADAPHINATAVQANNSKALTTKPCQDENCIFCKIITGKAPAKVIEETDTLIVIEDISPCAPIHWLIIPKKHLKDLTHLTTDDHKLALDLILMAQKLSQKSTKTAQFKLLNHNGPKAFQTVFHIHVHFMAGY